MASDDTCPGTCPVEDWIRMYRKGSTGAGIAEICDEPDILKVLKALSAAKRADVTLESEHVTNLLLHAREVQESVVRGRIFTASWQGRLEELQAYVRDNGRMPRQAGGDASETGLGRWLHAQRSKVGKGTLDSRQRAALNAVGAWDSDRRLQRDMSRLPAQVSALTAFRARHKRWPTYMNRTDEHEHALGTWLHTVRQAAREGRLPDPIRRALDEQAAGWLP